MGEAHPQTLSYRTPPPQLRSRVGWRIGRVLVAVGLVLMILSGVRVPMESGHRALVREIDLGQWFRVEPDRRSWEADRRAGRPVGPEPPWPRPTVHSWLTVRSL